MVPLLEFTEVEIHQTLVTLKLGVLLPINTSVLFNLTDEGLTCFSPHLEVGGMTGVTGLSLHL